MDYGRIFPTFCTNADKFRVVNPIFRNFHFEKFVLISGLSFNFWSIVGNCEIALSIYRKYKPKLSFVHWKNFCGLLYLARFFFFNLNIELLALKKKNKFVFVEIQIFNWKRDFLLIIFILLYLFKLSSLNFFSLVLILFLDFNFPICLVSLTRNNSIILGLRFPSNIITTISANWFPQSQRQRKLRLAK